MPKYSILIPTRERPRTLKFAIESVLAQSVGDFEIVVADNASGPETAEVVRAAADPRVVHVVAPERLSMSENWEAGLLRTCGRFVMVLGDDDAFLPDGLARVDACLDTHDVPIVAWPKNVTYWWSDAIVPRHRDRLYVEYSPSNRVTRLASRELLEAFYAFEAPYEALPSIYTSMVSRDVIDKVMARHGKYFLTSVPDIYSGIVNAGFTEGFARLPVGASLAGNSGASTGCSALHPNLNGASYQRFCAENEKRYGDLDPSLVDSPSLEIHLADQAIKTKALFFPDDDRLSIRIERVIGGMLGQIGRNVDVYDRVVADAKKLARKHGGAILDSALPPRPPAQTEPYRGFYRADAGVMVAVDCARAGVFDAAAAARLAGAMLP